MPTGLYNRIEGIRIKALRLGRKFYIPPTPCIRCQTTKRFSSNGKCVICLRRYLKSSLCKQQRKMEYAKYKDRVLQVRAKHYQENRKSILAKQKAYGRKNPHVKEKYERERAIAFKRQTPKWANLTTIEKFYFNCPEGMTVDHKIPLRGKLVSGLHIRNNLRYLTNSENASKGNRFVPMTIYAK